MQTNNVKKFATWDKYLAYFADRKIIHSGGLQKLIDKE